MRNVKLYREGEKLDQLYLPGIVAIITEDDDYKLLRVKENTVIKDKTIPIELYKEGDKYVADVENRLTVGDNSETSSPYSAIEVSNVGF